MEQKNYWNELLKCGAIIGVVEIAASVLGMVVTPAAALISLVALVAYVVLMHNFTRQRAAQMPAEVGFSYGDGWKYMVMIGLFAGILTGVYEIFARNILFTAQYDEAMAQAMGIMARSMRGQMAEMKEMMHRVMYSPVMIVFSCALGGVIKGAFFGLFIAAFTSRKPDIFADKKSE